MRYILNFINFGSKKLFYSTLALTLSLILLISAFLPTFAAEKNKPGKEVVKVGIFDDYGYYQTSKTGVNFGYGYDYLKEIEQYANIEYKYIKDSYPSLLEMLKKGEIDLLDATPKTEAYTADYNVSELSTGRSYISLRTLSDNTKFAYNDFKVLNGCKLGVLNNKMKFEEYQKFANANEFSNIITVYDDVSAMKRALQSCEVDAILSDSMRVSNKEKEVARFSNIDYYMITNIENTALMNKINSALKEIQLNNYYFNQDLCKKHFDIKHKITSLTRNELNYINNIDTLDVAYSPDWAPFEYYDEKADSFRGVNRDIMDLISASCGLKFNYVKTNSYESSIQLLSKGEADLLSCFDSYPEHAEDLNVIISDSYMSAPVAFVGLTDTPITQNSVIGLPASYLMTIDQFRITYPKNPMVIYKNINDCYDAILDKKVDFTLENIYVASDIINSKKYGSLKIVKVSTLLDTFAIAAKKDIDPILINILNKTIANISTDETTAIINKHVLTGPKNLTFKDFLNRYSIPIMISSLLIMFLIAVSFAYFTYFQRKSKETLWATAYLDPLTKLINLQKFKLDAVELLSKSSDIEKYFIIRFDIDNFKMINDRFGYAIGDKVLLYIVNVVSPIVSDKDLFARISGDDFVILGSDENYDSIRFICNRLIEEFHNFSIFVENHYNISFACGIYRIKSEDQDTNTMLDRAKIAHKQAKRMGLNSVVFYSEKFLYDAKRAQEIENTMRSSLKNGDFVIYLQPQYELENLNLCGSEALIRWNHPDLGFLSPVEFIPIFEKNGFIIALDNFVLEEICKFQRKQLDRGSTSLLPISVNQSRLHLSSPDYRETITSIVAKYNLPTKLIEFELTESALHEDIDNLLKIVKDLKESGFLISIDDFGSGYSSLNMLKDITADFLKIDREFLVDSENNHRGQLVLSNIISLSKSLGMQVISEGVETKEQETLLKQLGCHIVQGFLYAKPMPINEFDELLTKLQ